jgi:hypothetical protein
MGYKFSIDDEVKVSRATYSERYHKRGTVQEIDGTYRWPYYVEFDDGTGGWFAEEELSLVEAAPNPEPTLAQRLAEEALNTPSPDDVKDQALWEFLVDSQDPNAPTAAELNNTVKIPGVVSMAFSLGSDPVTEPEHYKAGMPEGVEVIDVIREQGLLFEFSLGNAIKYVLRAKYKGALKQDLRKARQYLDWAIESAPEED